MSRDMIGLTFDEIEIGDERRPVDRDAVKRIAASIKEIGLQHPITVRSIKGRFHLVAGRHRLEAVRSLGHETIKATIVSLDQIDARRWEIAENLHRAELTVQQRSDQIAEWVRLTEEKRVSGQVTQKSVGRPEGGVAAAARELGLERTEVRRAEKIASISEEAKEAAREAGLDDNQSALLKVARAEPERQADTVREIAEARALKIEQDVQNRAAQEVVEILVQYVPADFHDFLKANIHAAGKISTILAAFNNLVGQSIMDRRYGTAV